MHSRLFNLSRINFKSLFLLNSNISRFNKDCPTKLNCRHECTPSHRQKNEFNLNNVGKVILISKVVEYKKVFGGKYFINLLVSGIFVSYTVCDTS